MCQAFLKLIYVHYTSVTPNTPMSLNSQVRIINRCRDGSREC